MVCKDHSKKRRQDPAKVSASLNSSNTSSTSSGNSEEYAKKDFKKICDICEDKYLKWQINYSF